MTHAAQLGFKWRRIAGMLPNRSDDAVRNRFKRLEKARRHNDTTGVVATDTGERLEEARRHNDTTGVVPDTGYERSSVYKWEDNQRSRVQAAATKARPEAWEAKPNAWDLAGSFSAMAVA